MQAAILQGRGNVELSPIINDKGGLPLLKVDACGVCATDRKAFCRPPFSMQLPRVLGHECCGTLLADHGTLRKGSRVVLWPALACGSCLFCNSTRPHLCGDIRLFGLHLDGGFSSTISVPGHLWQKVVVLPLPPALTASKAVFAEPLGCVLHGLGRAQPSPSKIMIFGAGLIGCLAAQVASCLWPDNKIMLYDSNPLRRHSPVVAPFVVAKAQSADLIFIACSSQAALALALDLLEPGGSIILFSGLPDDENILALDHNRLHRKEQSLTGSYGCTPQDMVAAIDLLAHDQVLVDDLITRILPLAELEKELSRKTNHDDYRTIIALQT